jgi:hypothetical protein
VLAGWASVARILNKARLEARSRPVFGLDMTIATMVKQSGMDLLYNCNYCFSALMTWQAPDDWGDGGLRKNVGAWDRKRIPPFVSS